MADKTLHDAFIDELRDTYDAEKQLIKALPKLARAASSAFFAGVMRMVTRSVCIGNLLHMTL